MSKGGQEEEQRKKEEREKEKQRAEEESLNDAEHCATFLADAGSRTMSNQLKVKLQSNRTATEFS